MKKLWATMLILFAVVCAAPHAQAVATNNPRDFANVVIFAEFSDTSWGTSFQQDAEKIIGYYNGASQRSVTNYLDAISYGNFKLHTIFPQKGADAVAQPVKLGAAEAEAQARNIDTLVIEAAKTAYPTLSEQLDYDNDGFIDNVTVILKTTIATADSGTTAVSHKGDYPAGSSGSGGWSGKHIGTYNIINSASMMDGTLAPESCLLAHEFLHSLGYTDLYTANNEIPVGVWDIMAQTNYGMPLPLAYARMYFTDWLTIDTVTQSTTLTLHEQSNAGGNQAYILQSPLNKDEVFVVEFRKRPERSNINTDDAIDYYLPSSGLIVYRVNTTVDRLSNLHGDKYGVYVFRPVADGALQVSNAALSVENNRTSIGTSDRSKGLKDGALTFSDGSNSGIVISEVSSAAGDSMTCKVEIPVAADYDLWTDTGFSGKGQGSDIIVYNDMPYLVCNTGTGLQTYRYCNNAWESVGTVSGRNIMDAKLAVHNGACYLVYATYDEIHILKQTDSGWTQVASAAAQATSIDCASDGSALYIAYNSDTFHADLGKLENDTFTALGSYFSQMCGQPQVCVAGGAVYTAVRNATNDDNIIALYRYQNGGFTPLDSSVSGGYYDLCTVDDTLYEAVSKTDGTLTVRSFDGTSWKTVDSDISCGELHAAAVGDDLYIIAASNQTDGPMLAYRYDTQTNSLAREGELVDSTANTASFTASNDTLYVAVYRSSDQAITVRKKMASGGAADTPHTHTWTTQNARAATCTQAGYTGDRVCSCGEKQSGTAIAALGHSWNGGVVTKPAQVGVPGIRTYTCTRCRVTRTEQIAALPSHTHTWTTQNARAATCTQAGYTGDRVCSCGEKQSGTAIAALGHSWNGGVVTKPAQIGVPGIRTYTCTRCKVTRTERIAALTPQGSPFVDVQNPKDYYYTAVLWAAQTGVTSGTSATTFSPNMNCTRGQVVTFLWRAAGSPEPKPGRMAFTDVQTGAYYEKAVRWAAQTGVTSGTSATTFSPEMTVTRSQFVTFLWRYAGQPSLGAKNPFTDIQNGTFYYRAVLWAVQTGVTSGTSATTFSPEMSCSRGQVVTFLHRYAQYTAK